MKITYSVAGRTLGIECNEGTSCAELRTLIAEVIQKDLSNIELYNGNGQKLQDTDEAPAEVIGVKKKNSSAS